MSTNLFVGNLTYDVTDAQLAQLFAQAGTVRSAHVVTDKFSGQSRGYGFVEMSTEAEAARAITLLNGQEVRGRALAVNQARPREERGFRRSGGYGRGDARERHGRG
jgi:RNA recognition motif-containing protein